MSNKKKREKAAAQQAEVEKRKRLIEEMNAKIGFNKYNYENYSTASDIDNEMWGYFAEPGHRVRIHVAACSYGSYLPHEKIQGKVWMTVRANPDDSCALSKHIYSEDVDEIIATFNEYKALAESVPETTNWRWYTERGFKYYQV
jgi:hypothetical protein